MRRLFALSSLVAVGASALILAGGAAGANLDEFSIRQLPAATRYVAQVSPAEGQTGCEVSLTAELLRARPRRAPRVVRRSVSSTDICVTGEAGVTFTTVRSSGNVSTRGLPSGRYVFRLTADSAGPGGALLSSTGSVRPLLRVLTIRPVRVARGNLLTFSGVGWPARAAVLVAAGPPQTSPGDRIARLRTNAEGRFSRTVRIGRRAAPGPYVGIALLPNGEKSSARFRIV